VLVKQIAGALAKRIVNYLQVEPGRKAKRRNGIYQVWLTGGYIDTIKSKSRSKDR
jgi:hypothetical protein